MDYFTLKAIHQTAVSLSVAGFFARGLGGLMGAGWVSSRAAKTVPHGVDTVLLLSALMLAWTLRLNPLTTPWLAAKIVALLVYIGLGSVALNSQRTARVRAVAWVAALASFGYIVSVALTKSPLPFLGW
ncbi:MAG: SirB2 family protein [Cytophagales bacterium]|nr:SirB2 family protein [Rhizobacter sp.]